MRGERWVSDSVLPAMPGSASPALYCAVGASVALEGGTLASSSIISTIVLMPTRTEGGIMRLWSLHPQYLDTAGLTACWREALLAQAALAGRTRGYTRHPQLNRFRESTDPLGAVAAFLDGIHAEATSRGFSYDATRIDEVARLTDHIDVTRGQLDYELEHLRRKLARRSPERLEQLPTSEPTPHPLFRVIDGPIADWEVR